LAKTGRLCGFSLAGLLYTRKPFTVDGVLGDGNTMLVRRRTGAQRRPVARISAAAVVLRRRLADGASYPGNACKPQTAHLTSPR